MKFPSKQIAVLALAAFSTFGVAFSNAQSSLITFSVDMSVQIGNATFTPGVDTVGVHGTFNGWASFVDLVQDGTSSIYTNTINDTAEANGTPTKFQFAINPSGSTVYEQPADGNNRTARLPETSGAGLVLPTPFFSDAGNQLTTDITFQVDMSQQIALGNFTNGESVVEVQGNFNGWSAGVGILALDPTILRTNQFGLVTSNVYVGTFSVSGSTNASMDYKYVIEIQKYEGVNSLNADSGGNRFFTLLDQAQSFPVVDYSDAPYAPIAQVTFNVDMSAVLLSDPNYDPSTVVIDGDFNSWSADVSCTNNPAASNTNVYSTTIAIGEGSSVNYQFRYMSAGTTIYDHPANNPGGNRYFLVPSSSVVNVPTVFFNDITASDLLNVDTTVLFSVDMTNAKTYPDSVAFDANTDNVFINGDFLGWLNWDPISLASEQLTNNPPGSEVYSFSYTFPKGHARELSYKYSINGTDNEAASGQNHFRYIRSTDGTYNLPLDTFGVQTAEQKFGNLAIGPVSGAYIPVTWLGYPGVRLQVSSDLSKGNGAWTDLQSTDGLNSTNWPLTSDNEFFRLVQPQ